MADPLPSRPAREPQDTQPMLLVKGRVIAGRYLLGERIGTGAQGDVYRATQIDLERAVALKILIDRTDEVGRERLLREAQLTAEVKHPGVAVVYDAGVTSEGQSYCVMELLSGETLAQVIRRDGPLPAERLVPIAASICSALEAVHNKKLIHRDIKPSNIFLAKREDGGVDPKLIDFGIAKSVAVDGPEVVKRVTLTGLGRPRTPIKTLPGRINGTPVYLSPETVSGAVHDARSDLYALAATLYEALTGTPPFLTDDASELLVRILCEEPEPPETRAPDARIPPLISAVILRGLSKEPERRYASAAELANALWAALAESKGAALPSEHLARISSDLPALPVSSWRRIHLVALVAAAALLAFALIMLGKRSPAPAPSAPAPSVAVSVAPSASAPPPPASAAEASAPPPASAAPAIAHGAKSAKASASQAPAITAAPPVSPAPPSSGFRIDDLKTPF